MPYIDTDFLKCTALAANKDTFTFDEVISLIDSVKPADVQEVKHGKWIKARLFLSDHDCWTCNLCRRRSLSGLRENYCPHCGAKMDEEETE